MSFYVTGPFSELIIVKNEPESEFLDPVGQVTNNNRASADTENTMPAPNNVVIKTEPTTTHTIEPASVCGEIVVKSEPPASAVTRSATARKKTTVYAEPSTSRAMQPPIPARPNTHDQLVPIDLTLPNPNRGNIVVKTEPISPKRARISPDPDQLYTQLKALGDRGGFITNAEEFDCVICMVTIEVGDGVRLRDCLHEFCLNCMKRAIVLSDEAEIPCPFGDGTTKCDGKILELEIRAILDKEAYEKYLIRSLRIAESTIQNTVHCKLPNCDGWCICEDNVNQFVCQKCDSVNCVSCQAIHTGRNCKQYQDDLKYADLDGDTRRSQIYLDEIVEKKLGMKCPKCQIVIMKRTGCDWLRCSMCRTEICWVTKQARWGPKGHGDTSGGCGCRINGQKCHPQCGNCH